MLLSSSIKAANKTRATTVAIISFVAVGVAALTTAFNLADGALWRSPPFADPSRIVSFNSVNLSAGGVEQRARFSYARIQQLKQAARSFSAMANYTASTPALLSADGAESVPAEYVSPEYFGVLSVRPALGRLFAAADDSVTGAHPIVLVSHQLWQRKYSARADFVGTTISLGGVAFTVVGVLPDRFHGLSGNAQLWMPTTMAPIISYPEYLTTDQNFINVVGRLKPGISLVEATAEMKVLAPQIYSARPVPGADTGLRSTAVVRTINELRVTPSIRKSVLTLLAAVALLHLLACTNAASLLLSKASSRRREMAVRQALGATTRRLLPAVISESALLVVAGGILGLLLAFWTNTLLPPPDQIWNTQNGNSGLSAFAEPAFGRRSLGFGSMLVAVTTLLISWIPASGLLRTDMSSNLRDGARGFTVGGATLRRPNARGVIVAFETALAVMLLLAGGLMIDSFQRMRTTDLGINVSNVLTFDLRVGEARVPVEQAPAFVARLLDVIKQVPGVVSVTVDGGAPVSGSASSSLRFMDSRAQQDLRPPVLRHYVAPEHFQTLGIPLLAGRSFTNQDDANHPRVIIISALAAKRFWPNENPIGQRVWFGGGSNFDSPERSGEIVGVVGDVAYQRLDNEPFRADFYTPYMQFTYASRIVFIRTLGDPTAMTTAIRAAMKSVAPDLPIRDVQTLNDLVGKSWTRQRFDAMVFGVFAALALLLSTSGIYAVVSYAISQRTREMGIRLALGATNGTVVRLVLREGMAFPLIGLGMGLIASFGLSRVIAFSLYQVSPTDPFIVTRTLAVLVLASMAACAVPAWRATRVDPLVAMRTD